MGRHKNYLPTTDDGLFQWSGNFFQKISLSPAAVGLTQAEVDAYGVSQQAYAQALAIAVDPRTRGVCAVAAKNQAKVTLTAKSRQLAMVVTRHPGITDVHRVEMGLTVREAPSRVQAPATSPGIDIVRVDGRIVTIRLRDEMKSRRGRPANVKGANVYVFAGDVPATDPALWRFEGGTSRTQVDVDFGSALPPGTKVWFTACWLNAKLQTGPACPPVPATLNFGGPTILRAA